MTCPVRSLKESFFAAFRLSLIDDRLLTPLADQEISVEKEIPKSIARWTINTVADERHRIEASFADIANPQDKLTHLLKMTHESQGDLELSSLLTRFTLIQLSLEHHARHGGMPDSEVARLFDAACMILSAAGVKPPTSGLSSLFSDLYLTMSEIYSKDGRLWDAAWTQNISRNLTYHPPADLEERNALAAGHRYLRLGFGRQAIEYLELIISKFSDSAYAIPAAFSLACAYRVGGFFAEARDIHKRTSKQRENLDPQLARSWSWDLLRLDVIEKGDFLPMLTSLDKKYNELGYFLEAKLWAYSLPGFSAVSRFPKAESIRRRLGTDAQSMKKLKPLYDAVQTMEFCHERDVSLIPKLKRLGESTANRASLENISDELLLLIASYRWLMRNSQLTTAQLIATEYRGLCERLSDGLSNDTLNALGAPETDNAPLETIEARIPRSKVGRGIAVTKMLAKTAQIGASNRLRQLVASKQHKDELQTEALMQISDILASSMGLLKGGVTKVGQIMGYGFHDFSAFTAPLITLQDGSPPSSNIEAEELVQSELGRPISELFSQWDTQPVAVGSIGQVYRAVTLDGTQVAVKVQHPGIANALKNDLDLLFLARPVIHFFLPDSDSAVITNEIRERLLEEVDYTIEAKNQKTFSEIFKNDPSIVIPRIHDSLSTRHVLTMDYVTGRTWRDFIDCAPQEEKNRAGEIIARAAFSSMFHHGVFNADPHPGNYLFLDDGRIAFIDFGCFKRWDQSFLVPFGLHLKAIIDRDPKTEEEMLRKINFHGGSPQFDFQKHYEIFSKIFLPLFVDEPFTISPDFTEFVQRVHFQDNPNLRYTKVPKDMVIMSRLAWGLISVLATLHATSNWREFALTQIYGERASWPKAPDSAELDLMSAVMKKDPRPWT